MANAALSEVRAFRKSVGNLCTTPAGIVLLILLFYQTGGGSSGEQEEYQMKEREHAIQNETDKGQLFSFPPLTCNRPKAWAGNALTTRFLSDGIFQIKDHFF